MNIIHINNGDFHAELEPDLLSELYLRNTLKLFLLMFQCPNENADAIREIPRYLSEAIPIAESGWQQVKKERETKFQPLPKGGGSSYQKKLNAKLPKKEKAAQAKYVKLLKIQGNFNFAKEKYNVSK